MLSIDKNKIDYLNKKSIDILDSIQEFEIETKNKSYDHINDSISNKPYTNLTDEILKDVPFRISTQDSITERRLSVKEVFQDREYGFDESNYEVLIKFIKTILKDKKINDIISFEFLLNKTLEWLFSAYLKKQISECFTDFIMHEMNDSVKEHDILFPTDRLEISGRFDIGGVTLLFIGKDYIDSLERDYIKNEENPNLTYYKHIRDSYQGGVFICTSVKAEFSKAVGIAFAKCSLAVDLLKICSYATSNPEYRISFDLSKKMKGKIYNEFLVQDKKKPYFFKINKESTMRVHMLDSVTWQVALDMGIERFNNFIANKNELNCELYIMIENSIRRLSEALSKSDLNQRTVEIFTILESLLLNDENSPILDSLTKYCSKLVTKDIGERKEIINLIKNMYKVRSNLVHHAINRQFDVKDLGKLQFIIFSLIITLIDKLDYHKNKISILNEIDDAIVNAY